MATRNEMFQYIKKALGDKAKHIDFMDAIVDVYWENKELENNMHKQRTKADIKIELFRAQMDVKRLEDELFYLGAHYPKELTTQMIKDAKNKVIDGLPDEKSICAHCGMAWTECICFSWKGKYDK